MFSYYGSKTNIVDYYPAPLYNKIIEPFAGSARYSLKYFENDIILIDKYETIINIWKWLQKCSVFDIKKLPHIVKPGQSLDDFTFDCEEAKHLMGFIIGYGMERPRRTASIKRMTERPNHVNYSLKRIEANLFKIKHWEIRLGCYSEIKNQNATWFVDPPYQFGGHSYIHNNNKLDFKHLGNWCKLRNGQVIVCENIKSDWLPFISMTKHRGSKGNQYEVIWSNMPTNYDWQQKTIFK